MVTIENAFTAKDIANIRKNALKYGILEGLKAGNYKFSKIFEGHKGRPKGYIHVSAIVKKG